MLIFGLAFFYKRLLRAIILLCFALLPVIELAAQSEPAEPAGQAEQAEPVEQAAQAEQTAQAEPAEQDTQAEQTAQAEPAGQATQAEQTAQAGQAEPVEQTEADGSEEAVPDAEADSKSGSAFSAWLKKTRFSFGGSLLIFEEDYGFEAAPIPILPAPGFAFTMPLLGLGFAGIALETTLDLYFTYYKYSYQLQRPVPAEIENRSAFVFGPVFAFQAQGYINLNKVRVRLNAGIAADPRIVLLAPDLNEADLEDANRQTNDIRAFYKEFNQWLYPVFGLGADFQVTPRWSAGLDLRTWMPLDSDNADEQFLGWRFGIGIRATRLIGAQPNDSTQDTAKEKNDQKNDQQNAEN